VRIDHPCGRVTKGDAKNGPRLGGGPIRERRGGWRVSTIVLRPPVDWTCRKRERYALGASSRWCAKPGFPSPGHGRREDYIMEDVCMRGRQA